MRDAPKGASELVNAGASKACMQTSKQIEDRKKKIEEKTRKRSQKAKSKVAF